MPEQTSWRQIKLGLLAFGGLILLVFMPQPLPDHLLKYDFQAYWGASYLLGQSQNFSDPDLLLQVQQSQTGWEEEMAQMTWNPPWLLVFFLPYTWLPFAKASWLWFLTNIGLLFSSVVLLWNMFVIQEKSKRMIWLGLIISFLFVPTLAAILVGQITTLVLLGLSGFLFFMQRQRPFTAGLLLSLTTVKPHLVYITLPLILLEMIRQKQWRVVAGLVIFPLVGTIITFGLRPSFLAEYFTNITGNGLFQYAVPTLTYWLANLFNWPGLRLVGLLILPLTVIWWLRQKQPIDLYNLMVMTLLLSIITAPYGWSFDIMLLLIPVLSLLAWTIEGLVSKPYLITASLLFAAINGLILYIRTLEVQESQFFWVAPAIALLYGWGWQNKQNLARAALRDSDV